MPPKESPSDDKTAALGRRIAGIGILFACALVVDPARVVPEVTAVSDITTAITLHSLIIPALSAIGLWLVLPSTTVLAICVLMLASAHAEPGQSDLFSGYLYPALAALACFYLIKTLFFSTAKSS